MAAPISAEWDDSEGGGYGEGDDAPWSMPGGGAGEGGRSRGSSLQQSQSQSLSAAARALEQAAQSNHHAATGATTVAQKTHVKEFMMFVKKIESVLSSTPLADSASNQALCNLVRAAVPTVRAAASRSPLGLRFWSRLDRAALVEHQSAIEQLLEESGVDLHAAVDEAPGMSASSRPALQRSVSALGVAPPRVGPTAEESRLLDPLRPSEFDPYALLETELGMFEQGTRETVLAAIDTWLTSKDAAVKKPAPKKKIAGKWQPPKRGVSAKGEPTGDGGNLTQADKAAKNRARVIWIQGGPGAGKSVVLSKIASKYASQVIGVHLCKHQTSRSAWAGMIKSLAFQMAERCPEYRRLLLAELTARAAQGDNNSLGSMSALELFQTLLTGLLIQIPNRPELQEADAVEESKSAEAGASPEAPGAAPAATAASAFAAPASAAVPAFSFGSMGDAPAIVGPVPTFTFTPPAAAAASADGAGAASGSAASSPAAAATAFKFSPVAIPSPASAAAKKSKLLLLIDALDESDSATNPELLLLFKDAWQWPSWVGLVLTSRPVVVDARGGGAAAAASSSSASSSSSAAPLDYTLVELQYDSQETQHDMRLFVGRRLAELMPHASDSERTEATRVIWERSGGMFLFARLVCQVYEEQMSRYKYELECREEAQRQALLRERQTEGQTEGEGEGEAGSKELPPLLPPALDAQSLARLPLGLNDYFRRTMQRVADALEAGQSDGEAAGSALPAAASSSSSSSNLTRTRSTSSVGEGMRRLSLLRQKSGSAPVTLAEIMRLLRVVLAAQEPLSVSIVARLMDQPAARVLVCLEPLRSLFPVLGNDSHAVISSCHKSVLDWLSSEERLAHDNERRFFVNVREGHCMLATEGWKLLTHKNPALVNDAAWQAQVEAMTVDQYVNPDAPPMLTVDECAATAPDSLLAYASRFQAIHALRAGHLPLLLACLTHLSFIELRLRGQQGAHAAAASNDSSGQGQGGLAAVSAQKKNTYGLLLDYHIALTTIQEEITRAGAAEAAAAFDPDEYKQPAPIAAAAAHALERSIFRKQGQSGQEVQHALQTTVTLLRPYYRFVRTESSHFASNPVLVYQDAINYPSVSPLFVQAAHLRSWWATRCDWCEWINKPDSDKPDPCLLVLQGHTGSVDSCLFVRDLIISGSDDFSVRIWDSVSGEVRAVLQPAHKGAICTMKYRADLHLLYTASNAGTLHIFDLHTYQMVQSVDLGGCCLSIAFTPSFRRAAFAITEKRVQIMNLRPDGTVDTSVVVAVINEEEWCSRVLFHSETVLLVCTERSLELWEYLEERPAEDKTRFDERPVLYWAGQHQMERLLHGDSITSLETITVSGRRFYVTGAEDAIAYLFEAVTTAEGRPHLDRITRLQYNAEGRMQRAPIRCIRFAPYGVRDAPFHAAHPEIAARAAAEAAGDYSDDDDDEDEAPAVAAGEGGEDAPPPAPKPAKKRPLNMAVRVAFCFTDNSVRIFELKVENNNLTLDPLALFLSHTHSANCIDWNADGTLLVSSSQDDRLCVWDVRTHAVRTSPDHGVMEGFTEGHQDAVTALAITPDGRRIVSGGIDGSIRVWNPNDAITPQLRIMKNAHVGAIESVAITAFKRFDDSYAVASGGNDRMIRVFDIDSGMLMDSAHSHHSSEIRCLCASQDGNTLVSSSKDGTTRVWNTVSGRVEHSLCRGRWVMSACAFIPFPSENRGKFPGLIVTGNGEGTIQIWSAGSYAQLGAGSEDSVGSARMLLETQAHSDSVVSIYVSYTNSVFCTVSSEGMICVWQWDWNLHLYPEDYAAAHNEPQREAGDLKRCLKMIQTLPRWPFLQASTAVITADNRWLLFGGPLDSVLCCYSLDTRELVLLGTLPSPAAVLSLSRSSSRCYVGDVDGTVCMHDPDNPKAGDEEDEGDGLPQRVAIWSHKAHPSRITAMDVNEAETMLCTASFECKVMIFQISDAAVEAPADPASGRARGGLVIMREIDQVRFSPVYSLVFSPDASKIWVCGAPPLQQEQQADVIWELSVEKAKLNRVLVGEFEAVCSMAWQTFQPQRCPVGYAEDDAMALANTEDLEQTHTSPISSLLFQSEVNLHRWSVLGVTGSAPVQRVGWSSWKSERTAWLNNLAYPPNSGGPLVTSSNAGGDVLLWSLATPLLLEHAAPKDDDQFSAGWIRPEDAGPPLLTHKPVFDAAMYNAQMAAAMSEQEKQEATRDRYRQRSVVGWSPDERILAVASRERKSGQLLDLFTINYGSPDKWRKTLARLDLIDKTISEEAESEEHKEESTLELTRRIQAEPRFQQAEDEDPPTLEPCPLATRVAPASCHTTLNFSSTSKWLTAGTDSDGVRLYRVKRDECKSDDPEARKASDRSVRLEDVLSLNARMGTVSAAHFNDCPTSGPSDFPYLVTTGTDSVIRLFDLRQVVKHVDARAEKQQQIMEAAVGSGMPTGAPGMARAPSLTRTASILQPQFKPSSAGVSAPLFKFDFSASRTQQLGLAHIVCHTRDEPVQVPPPVAVPTVLQLLSSPAMVKSSLRELLTHVSQDWSGDSNLESAAGKFALRVARSGGMERCLLLVKHCIAMPPSDQLSDIIALACSVCGHVALAQRMASRILGAQRESVNSASLIRRTFPMLLPLLKRFHDQPLMLSPIYSACNCVTELWNRAKADKEFVTDEMAMDLTKQMCMQLAKYASLDGELPAPTLHDNGTADKPLPRATPAQERGRLLRLLTNSLSDLVYKKKPLFEAFHAAHGLQLLLQLVTSEDSNITDYGRTHALSKLDDICTSWAELPAMQNWIKQSGVVAAAYRCFDSVARAVLAHEDLAPAAGSSDSSSSSSSSSSAVCYGGEFSYQPFPPTDTKFSLSQLVTYLTRTFGSLRTFIASGRFPPSERVPLMKRVLALWRALGSFAFKFPHWNTWWNGEICHLCLELVREEDAVCSMKFKAEEAAAAARVAAAAGAAPVAPADEGEGVAVPEVTGDGLWNALIDARWHELILHSMERFGTVQERRGGFQCFRDVRSLLGQLAGRQHVALYELLGGYDTWHRMLSLYLRVRDSDPESDLSDAFMLGMFGRLHDAFEIREWYVENRDTLDRWIARTESEQQQEKKEPEEGAEGVANAQPQPPKSMRAKLREAREAAQKALNKENEAAAAAAAVAAAAASGAGDAARAAGVDGAEMKNDDAAFVSASASSSAAAADATPATSAAAPTAAPSSSPAAAPSAVKADWQQLETACLLQDNQFQGWSLRNYTLRRRCNHPFTTELLQSRAIDFFIATLPPMNQLNAGHMPTVDGVVENMTRMCHTLRHAFAESSSASLDEKTHACKSFAWLCERLRTVPCPRLIDAAKGGDPSLARIAAGCVDAQSPSVLVCYLWRVFAHPSVAQDRWQHELFFLLPTLTHPKIDLPALDYPDELAHIQVKIRRLLIGIGFVGDMDAASRSCALVRGAHALQALLGYKPTLIPKPAEEEKKAEEPDAAAAGAAGESDGEGEEGDEDGDGEDGEGEGEEDDEDGEGEPQEGEDE